MDIISHWSFFHIWGTVETWNSEKKEMSLSSGKHGFLSVTALLLKSGVTPGTLLQLHSQCSPVKGGRWVNNPGGPLPLKLFDAGVFEEVVNMFRLCCLETML